MSSCERIAVKDYNSEAQQRASQRAVDALLESPAMMEYVEHVERRETLYYCSIIAPLLMFIAFYADMIFGITSGLSFSDVFGSTVSTVPYGTAVVLFVVFRFFAAPCALVSPSCGLFRDVAPQEGIVLLVVQLLTQVASFNSDIASVDSTVVGLAVRIMSLQGGVLVSYWLLLHRSRMWKRQWVDRVPFSLFVIPFVVASFELTWRKYVALLADSITDSSGETAASGATLLEVVFSRCLTVVLSVAASAARDLESFITDPTETISAGLTREGMAAEWRRCFAVSLVSIGCAVAGPLLSRGFLRLEERFYPHHPTTILITAGSICAVVAVFGLQMSLLTLALCLVLLVRICTTEWSAEEA